MAKFFKITDEPIELSVRGRRELYPFSQLKERQSFKVSIPALKADRLKLIRSLRAAVTNANRRYAQQGSRFGVEIGDKHYRVGRLK